jgi:hypothetical protein
MTITSLGKMETGFSVKAAGDGREFELVGRLERFGIDGLKLSPVNVYIGDLPQKGRREFQLELIVLHYDAIPRTVTSVQAIGNKSPFHFELVGPGEFVAGGSLKLKGIFEANNPRLGVLSEKVTLHCSGDASTDFTVTIYGNILPAVWVEPRELVLDGMTPSLITVRSSSAPFEVASASSNIEGAVAEVLRISEDGRECVIAVTGGSATGTSESKGMLTIETTHADMPSIDVPVFLVHQ